MSIPVNMAVAGKKRLGLGLSFEVPKEPPKLVGSGGFHIVCSTSKLVPRTFVQPFLTTSLKYGEIGIGRHMRS